ncbi:MAG: hydroxyacylglutathione hydrolase [Methylocystis sp.]
MPIEVIQFRCLNDNFGLLVHDISTGATASIDAPDGQEIVTEIRRQGWSLSHLLITHHHADHVQGAMTLKKIFPEMIIIGSLKDAYRLPPLDRGVGEGDRILIGDTAAQVIETPGHTLGHIAYHFNQDAAVFVGDTLFSLGCGRVFEGTMEMMHLSLGKLANLPEETHIYCGHEYTQANGKFALTVDPENNLLKERMRYVDALRHSGQFTLPTTIALERATNPFLRVEDPDIKRTMGLTQAGAVEVFSHMRERKNNFRA